MFVNFDCSAYFVKDREGLMKTFEILPEYLKAKEGKTVNDYRDWGIQLGRRFRALKLWFVIRSFGVVGIQDKIRLHLKLAKGFATNIRESRDFELMAPVPLATVCFRYKPDGDDDVETLNAGNMRLMEALNATGKLYLTHTKLGSATTLRLSIGQTHTAQRHVDAAWKMIQSVARQNFIDIS
jgi:aromatic-L-amino-acid/L-tryptophan decarboxylase